MTTISAKITNDDKITFERICDSMEINISSAINSFVKAQFEKADCPLR